jgi:hypothetical protein
MYSWMTIMSGNKLAEQLAAMLQQENTAEAPEKSCDKPMLAAKDTKKHSH